MSKSTGSSRAFSNCGRIHECAYSPVIKIGESCPSSKPVPPLAPNGLYKERPDAFSFQHDVMWSERPAEHAVHRPDRWSHLLPGHSQALLLKKFLFKYMNKPYHVQFSGGCLNPQSFVGKILKLTFQLPGGWGEEGHVGYCLVCFFSQMEWIQS